MMLKPSVIAIAAVFLCLVGLSASPASAFPGAARSGFEADAASPDLLAVHARGGYYVYRRPHGNHHRGYRYDRHRNWSHWDRRYHGPRCRSWTSYCRHYYSGWYYANPWWGMPMIGAGVVINSGGNRHVAWCEGRYRSYNRRNNTWISNSGKVRQCVSPYGP